MNIISDYKTALYQIFQSALDLFAKKKLSESTIEAFNELYETSHETISTLENVGHNTVNDETYQGIINTLCSLTKKLLQFMENQQVFHKHTIESLNSAYALPNSHSSLAPLQAVVNKLILIYESIQHYKIRLDEILRDSIVLLEKQNPSDISTETEFRELLAKNKPMLDQLEHQQDHSVVIKGLNNCTRIILRFMSTILNKHTLDSEDYDCKKLGPNVVTDNLHFRITIQIQRHASLIKTIDLTMKWFSHLVNMGTKKYDDPKKFNAFFKELLSYVGEYWDSLGHTLIENRDIYFINDALDAAAKKITHAASIAYLVSVLNSEFYANTILLLDERARKCEESNTIESSTLGFYIKVLNQTRSIVQDLRTIPLTPEREEIINEIVDKSVLNSKKTETLVLGVGAFLSSFSRLKVKFDPESFVDEYLKLVVALNYKSDGVYANESVMIEIALQSYLMKLRSDLENDYTLLQNCFHVVQQTDFEYFLRCLKSITIKKSGSKIVKLTPDHENNFVTKIELIQNIIIKSCQNKNVKCEVTNAKLIGLPLSCLQITSPRSASSSRLSSSGGSPRTLRATSDISISVKPKVSSAPKGSNSLPNMSNFSSSPPNTVFFSETQTLLSRHGVVWSGIIPEPIQKAIYKLVMAEKNTEKVNQKESLWDQVFS